MTRPAPRSLAKPAALLLQRMEPTDLPLPHGLAFEEWTTLCHMAGRLHRATPWVVGALVVYGEDHFGARAEQVLDEMGLQPETQANYATVYRKVAASRRRETLPFGHHAEVAALPPAEQTQWLTRAEKEKWTREELRQQLGKGRKALEAPHPPHVCRTCNVTWEAGT